MEEIIKIIGIALQLNLLRDECVDQKCLVTLVIIMWLLRNVENIYLQGHVPERYLHETIPTVDQSIGCSKERSTEDDGNLGFHANHRLGI